MMLQQYNNYTTTTEATTTIKSTTNNNSSSAAAATTLTSTAAVLGSCFTGTGTQSGSSAQQFQHPHYYNSRMKYEEYSSSSSSLQGRPSLENGGCVKREAKCVKRETDQQQQQNTLLATPFVPSSIPLNGHRHYPQTYMGMGVMPTIPLANVFQQPSSSSQGPLGALEAMTEQQRLLTINDNSGLILT
jgi:hypothetical protein